MCLCLSFLTVSLDISGFYDFKFSASARNSCIPKKKQKTTLCSLSTLYIVPGRPCSLLLQQTALRWEKKKKASDTQVELGYSFLPSLQSFPSINGLMRALRVCLPTDPYRWQTEMTPLCAYATLCIAFWGWLGSYTVDEQRHGACTCPNLRPAPKELHVALWQKAGSAALRKEKTMPQLLATWCQQASHSCSLHTTTSWQGTTQPISLTWHAEGRILQQVYFHLGPFHAISHNEIPPLPSNLQACVYVYCVCVFFV